MVLLTIINNQVKKNMPSPITYVIFALLTVCSASAEFQVGDAVFSGFTHAAVRDVIDEPIKNALNPTVVPYYVCKEVDCLDKNQCYDNILDYNVTIPPSPIAIFMSWVIIILFLISFVVWCFTSTIDEKMEMIGFIICHIIGQIIYDILCGDDDD